MKKTILALSIGLLSACSQIPENAIVLSVGDDTAVFEENSQGLLVAEQKLEKGSYTFTIADSNQSCGLGAQWRNPGRADIDQTSGHHAQGPPRCARRSVGGGA